MKTLSVDEKNRNKKLNEAFLYDLGYLHVYEVCEETDKLLESYKALEYPKTLDRWFELFIKKKVKEIKRQAAIKRSIMITKRVAIFFIALLIVGATIIWNVEAFRVRVLNMLIKDEGRYTTIHAVGDIEHGIMDKKSPTYMPEYLMLQEETDMNMMMVMRFEGDNDLFLTYITSEVGGTTQIDTEDAVITQITINGCKGFYADKGHINMFWYDDFYEYTMTSNIGIEEMIKIAESVE